MPSHVHQLLVKTLLSFVGAAGLVGAVVLGFIGIRAGTHEELERILAIVGIATAAGSYLGLQADDSTRDDSTRDEKASPSFLSSLSFRDKIMLAVSAPLLFGCTLLFLLTLVPCWYVIVPTFAALWSAVFGREGRRAVPPAARRPIEQPAYG